MNNIKFKLHGIDIKPPQLEDFYFNLFAPDYITIRPFEYKKINFKISIKSSNIDSFYYRIEGIEKLCNEGLIFESLSFISEENHCLYIKVWNRNFPVQGDRYAGITEPTGTVKIQKNDLTARLIPIRMNYYD